VLMYGEGADKNGNAPQPIVTPKPSRPVRHHGEKARKRAFSDGVQTTAPAFGSSGSRPGLPPPLTRSSRLTPSHMAMEAATKQEE